GIPLASPDRWITVPACYATGWALGRLKYFPAAEISAAFGDGRLRPEDILLTDGVPADTPLVAGIISLTPSTPNSHTAILSQSFGIPFVYLANAAERQRVQQLVGHKVLLRAMTTYLTSQIKIVDLEGVLDPGFEAEVLALKRPEPIAFLPRQSYGALWASTETLVPMDIQYFGGKAANYGVLRRTVPTNCPVALAFSFDLWDAFLDQVLPGGQTLRAEIATRLAPFTNYPPDMVALKTNLGAIRDLFTKTASFTPLQQQAITNALASFNPRRNIRFRSSTNVEDSEHFTGAGLYDSYSGCLLDDLDGDTLGPCQCDPSEPKERGVFRALQKVYASFYNDDAYLERLRHGVDESQVGMGVLVHHSFPDEEELANGVATPRFSFSGVSANFSGDLVTQLGAASVTNPDGQSVPEVVGASRYAYTGAPSVSLNLKQRSSLVPLGAYVMDWQTDYKGLLELLSKVGLGFRQFYPAKTAFSLDFEYKKDAQMGLVIKQVREVPQPGTTNQVTPFLIEEPITLCVQQAGGGAVFATHRLKSLWTLHTTNLCLSSTNLTHGIYTQGSYEYLEDGTLQTLSGAMTAWPNAAVVPSGATNTWTTGSGANLRLWSLNTTLMTNVTGTQPPVLTQDDLPKTVTVTYTTP
ncbi:MAG TPA: PEP/pyruvate-binding domain-containing protein, partial [Bacillota bacterium]|nr:PEP/pyruvate-binding domain-containing protein [Bacillota bacterium]